MQGVNKSFNIISNKQSNIIAITFQLLMVILTIAFFTIGNVMAQDAKPVAQVNSTAEQSGTGANKQTVLSLQDAVKMALENNRDIEVERLKVQLNDFKLRAAQGVYDPNIEANLYYEKQTIPVASLFAGGDNGRLKTSNFAGISRLSKKLPWQGSSVEAEFENNRSTSNSLFNSLDPLFTNRLTFRFTQPLFRNRQIDAPRHQIQIAKKRLDLSDSEFRQRVIDIISQVQRAYWDLAFARRDQEIKREGVELAQAQLESNQRKVEKGTLAPLDVVSARVELERRTDEAAAADEAIHRAENALKTLLIQANNNQLWNTKLVPSEQPQMDADSLMPYDQAIQLAFKNRPEMEQYRLRADINQTDVKYYNNQTKPQVDFTAQYSMTGFAGKERTDSNPLLSSNDVLFNRVNQLSQIAGLPVIAPVLTETFPDKLTGSYGQSLGNLFRNDYQAWRVGVSINFSIGNRTAKANLGYALAEGRQIDAQRQRTEQTIQSEVRNALQAIETARYRFDAARNSRVDAELQHKGEQRKFESGLSSNFLILDRQNALSAARGRELKALTDYNKALVEFQRVLSTTLSNNNISIASIR
jgi:outer membrane protein